MSTQDLNFSKELLHNYAEQLLNWFYAARRELPFRKEKDPYKIWISEIMAQQTQIDTLIPYYERFIQAFPNIKALASADESTVLKLWEGLGYYSRARNLHKAAKMIVTDYAGQFPSSYKALIKLPGIGPYTGGAIASIAFNEKVPAVDGNVLRVVSRFNNYFGDIAEPKTKKEIESWVMAALPDQSGDFNEALMELGALICTPSVPKCLLCPVYNECASFHAGTVDQLPIKSKKTKQKNLKMEVGLVLRNNSLYFVKRPNSGLLSGLWGFPIVETTSNAEKGTTIRAHLTKVFPNLPDGTFVGTGKHVFSHIIWNMDVYVFRLSNEFLAEERCDYGETSVFRSLDNLEDIALPVAFSKLLTLL